MKIVMTLTVRDEADVLDAQIRYHLESGVDFVIATDHRSTDGTTDILRRYEREGHAFLIRNESDGFFQSTWVTRMARLAATDFAADWVINSDADEFWWPRRESLREALAAVPARYGVIRGLWRNFVLRPDTAEPFYDRMTVRTKPYADAAHPYHAQLKVAHRADPLVRVPRGNHDAFGKDLRLIREWFPLEVLHFPIRSREHLSRKYQNPEAYLAGDYPRIPRHIEQIAAGVRQDPDLVFESLAVDDARVEQGLADGTLSRDTRLRDRLRGVAPAADPSLRDDAAFAAEAGVVLEDDTGQRLRARVDVLDERLRAVQAAGRWR
jgi:hypothetical protein